MSPSGRSLLYEAPLMRGVLIQLDRLFLAHSGLLINVNISRGNIRHD